MDGLIDVMATAGETIVTTVTTPVEASTAAVETIATTASALDTVVPTTIETDALASESILHVAVDAPSSSSLFDETGPDIANKIAKAVLDDPDEAFDTLSVLDLSADTYEESIPKDGKIIQFPGSKKNIPQLDANTEQATTETVEKKSAEYTLEQDEPIDLEERRKEMEDKKLDELDTYRRDMQEQRIRTLNFLKDNPGIIKALGADNSAILDALDYGGSLSEEQIKEIIEKIEKLKALEKDAKKKSLLGYLLAIIMGTFLTFEDEVTESVKPSAQ